MKNIFKIYKRDLKNIFTNWAALVITVALIILPSLYAWFNIKSSWDPYGNTNGIKVAIVNSDKGGEFANKEYDIGNEIVDSLKENNAIGWCFVSEDEAKKGVELGKYYASIKIPEDFTEDLLSIVSGNIIYPKLEYTVNQKSNAIAPKITDKGVTSIQSQIGSKVVDTVDGIIFEIFNKIGLEILNSKGDIKNLFENIHKLDNDLPEMENIINKAYDGTITVKELTDKVNKLMPTLEETLELSTEVLDKSNNFLNNAKDSINQFEPVIKEDLLLVGGMINNLNNVLANINTDTNLDQVKEALVNLETKINNVINPTLTSIIDMLTSINSKNNEVITNAINKLQNIQSTLPELAKSINSVVDDLNNKLQVEEAKIEKVKGITNNINGIITSINNNYDSEIMPQIKSEVNKLSTIVDNGTIMVNEAKNSIPDVKKVISLLAQGSDFGSEKLLEIKSKFPTLKEKLDSIVEKLSLVNDDQKIDALLDLLISNSSERSTFLSSPIEIEQENLFDIPNYGSAMSPFYSTLALWVGGLLLISLFTTKTKPLEEGVELKAYEKYFGKYLTFVTLGILQGLVVSTGDIFILGTYVLHPVYFVLGSMFISIVFVTIIFSLVSIFDNVGKAIAIIYLVLQVAASGGTFPIEVMSSFFQNINPLLPFKYGIGLMREFIAGIVPELVTQNIFYLVIYGIIFILMAVFLKKFINKYTDKLSEKLEESGLSGH